MDTALSVDVWGLRMRTPVQANSARQYPARGVGLVAQGSLISQSRSHGRTSAGSMGITHGVSHACWASLSKHICYVYHTCSLIRWTDYRVPVWPSTPEVHSLCLLLRLSSVLVPILCRRARVRT
jgi:hypothetical protein